MNHVEWPEGVSLSGSPGHRGRYEFQGYGTGGTLGHRPGAGQPSRPGETAPAALVRELHKKTSVDLAEITPTILAHT